MATSTVVPAISVEEYLHTSYEHDCEYVDGEIKERSMPDELHSAIQQFLSEYFGAMKRELGIRVRVELRVKVAAQRFRIPDVTLLRADAAFKPIPTEPPVLCVEIISPDDRVGDLLDKIEDYVAMGVRAIWVIDPRRRTMRVANGEKLHLVQEFAIPGSTRKLTKAELFAELDELERLRQ